MENEKTTLVDARGLFCPLPILKLKQALADTNQSEKIKLLATDKGLLKDIQLFCKYQKASYKIISDDGDLEFIVWKNHTHI